VVEIVVKEGPDRIKEIIEYGARFDKEESGEYSLGREVATAYTAYCIIKM